MMAWAGPDGLEEQSLPSCLGAVTGTWGGDQQANIMMGDSLTAERLMDRILGKWIGKKGGSFRQRDDYLQAKAAISTVLGRRKGSLRRLCILTWRGLEWPCYSTYSTVCRTS